jgi:predicted nucleic acid-binding Zn finger protein
VKKDSERIESVVSGKRVKLHIFEPSKRKIWTVVGKGKEYWLDPDAEYCSCNGYYFGRLNEKTTCYHLESVYLAKRENKIETIVFSDDEYDDFLSGLISDL